MERPQDKFRVPVDNSPRPFRPIIRCKPNAKAPLDLRLIDDGAAGYYEHPYRRELEDLRVPIEHLAVEQDPAQPWPLDRTRLSVVETVDQLDAMVGELRGARELAVDLEAHTYRSYQGLTCLMQVSTDAADYIVDALALRDHMQPLNEAFTDPAIVKVLHGADNDVLWLQRDLGLYVVNMFDTYQAAKILRLDGKGLGHLLRRYCGVHTDKSYQLYDWRTRPLSTEAVHYARVDTHYLLYVYRVMKRDLSDLHYGHVERVFDRSADVCLQRYEINVLHKNSHLKALKGADRRLDARQMRAFRDLFVWRDRLSRALDESTGYVLPNRMLLVLAKALPEKSCDVLTLCTPRPTKWVRKKLGEIHSIIKKASNDHGSGN